MDFSKCFIVFGLARSGEIKPMERKIFCLAAICLIAGGCGTVGTSSRGTRRDGGLFPSLAASKSADSSFRQQVQNDPFPAASDLHATNMRVRVNQ
jgi:hypothetical protein